ncbi:testis-expressed sequence 2 -like protein [Labeo rohita]|uniref:Testis-expressed sequence 2-like protein n=1 Tax=Labeo rohita TaxID=84645 RepID=A0A498LU87_LABRO|nr:testis-expressed sequence 2 -like protein [Labeo rohita]
MVTCKETRAAIIALHKNGFTGKDIVATKIAPKSTIYRIIKNFKERGSVLVKKASGRPRKSSKRQDRLLKRIQLRDRSATSAELAQEWQQAGVSASARTGEKGEDFWKMAWCQEGQQRSHFSPKKKKHQGQIDLLQKVWRMDC